MAAITSHQLQHAGARASGAAPRLQARPSTTAPLLRAAYGPLRAAAGRGLLRPVQAIAVPVEQLTAGTPIPQLDDATRAAVAEQLGYRSIGKELPDDVTLGQVIKSMPKEVFELNPLRAWGAVVTTLVAMALSEYLIAISPWYLLPFAWAIAGTAATGFFVVGHDAGHRSFCKNKLLEVRGARRGFTHAYRNAGGPRRCTALKGAKTVVSCVACPFARCPLLERRGASHARSFCLPSPACAPRLCPLPVEHALLWSLIGSSTLHRAVM